MFKNPFQSNQNDENYYNVLGVNPTVDQDEILKAYIRLSIKYHPDKNTNNEAARDQFVKIGQAFEVLSDPNRRSAYDRYLLAGSRGDRSGFEVPTRPNSSQWYQQSFDNRVGGMSEKNLGTAKRVAAVTGGLIGSIVGSKLGGKVARGANGAGRVILQTTGSIIGSALGSDASSKFVQNVHTQSRDRNTYEERRRVAIERNEPVPEKPKGGWGGMKDSATKTVSDVNESKPVRRALYNGAMSNAQGITNAKNHKAARYFGYS